MTSNIKTHILYNGFDQNIVHIPYFETSIVCIDLLSRDNIRSCIGYIGLCLWCFDIGYILQLKSCIINKFLQYCPLHIKSYKPHILMDQIHNRFHILFVGKLNTYYFLNSDKIQSHIECIVMKMCNLCIRKDLLRSLHICEWLMTDKFDVHIKSNECH